MKTFESPSTYFMYKYKRAYFFEEKKNRKKSSQNHKSKKYIKTLETRALT